MKQSDIKNFETLLNWIEGQLPVAEAEKLAAQLKTADDKTRTLHKWIEAFQQLSQTYLLMPPPNSLDKKLYDIFTQPAKQTQQVPFFQRLQAILTFDSRQHPPLAGLRSAMMQQPERQYVYSTDLAEVTLNLRGEPKEKTVHLSGQVFPLDETDETIYIVALEEAATTLQMVKTTLLGKFNFIPFTPGSYDITVSGERAEIILTKVDLHF